MCARVLVVDDDPINADLLGYLLRAFGHDASLTFSGGEALRDAAAYVPDLVLCDIQMPVIDGYEVLARLRADHRFDDTQIVGVTALAMVGDREKLLAAGFDGYMAKPISPETFVEEIERYLPAGSTARPVAICQLPVAGEPLATDNRQRLTTSGYALVVDDHDPNADLMRHLIASLGAEVRTVRNAAEALRVARAERPTLVISDLHMPGLDGIELLEAMKSDPALRDIPFLLISASSASVDEQKRAIAAGAAGMLLRPIDPEALREQLTRFMRAESGA